MIIPIDNRIPIKSSEKIQVEKKKTTKKKLFSPKEVKAIEMRFFAEKKVISETSIKIGDLLRIGYLIPEGQKERTQYYEGIVIAKNNIGFRKNFTLRRTVQGIGVEQVFFIYSPKLVSLVTKQSSKVRRAKLYFIRALTGKKSRLKTKF